MVCTLIDHRNGIKMFKTLQLNHSPVRLWLVCRGSTRVDKSTDHAVEIVVDLLMRKTRRSWGETKTTAPFPRSAHPIFSWLVFATSLLGILAQVTRLLNNRLLSFIRLIEAQEGTREITKLNHIMKTKDARIENLESK